MENEILKLWSVAYNNQIPAEIIFEIFGKGREDLSEISKIMKSAGYFYITATDVFMKADAYTVRLAEIVGYGEGCISVDAIRRALGLSKSEMRIVFDSVESGFAFLGWSYDPRSEAFIKGDPTREWIIIGSVLTAP